MTIREALEDSKLDELEVEIILASLLNKDRSFIYAHPEYRLAHSVLNKLTNRLRRRSKGEPLAYILGYKEFYGLKFFVDKHVLIPRPETETLVDETLSWIKKQGLTSQVICDVGTGSGCIAISLAKHLPSARIYAIDLSKTALEVAKKNAKLHGVAEKIIFLQGNLLLSLPEKVDILVANLPYIPTKSISSLQTEIRDWEPKEALDGGPDGMALYDSLFEQSKLKLKPHGIVFYECDGQIHSRNYKFKIE